MASYTTPLIHLYRANSAISETSRPALIGIALTIICTSTCSASGKKLNNKLKFFSRKGKENQEEKEGVITKPLEENPRAAPRYVAKERPCGVCQQTSKPANPGYWGQPVVFYRSSATWRWAGKPAKSARVFRPACPRTRGWPGRQLVRPMGTVGWTGLIIATYGTDLSIKQEPEPRLLPLHSWKSQELRHVGD